MTPETIGIVATIVLALVAVIGWVKYYKAVK